MKTSAHFPVIALLCCAVSVFSTTTEIVKFCSDSSDQSTWEDNVAAAVEAGWVYNAANGTKMASGNYSYPAKFTSGKLITSKSYYASTGEYITHIVLNAQVSSLDRTADVTPQYEDGTWGDTSCTALSETGKRKDVIIDYDATQHVVAFKVTFTVSGTSTAYLYYVTVTTDTPPLMTLDTPTNLSAVPNETSIALSWDAVTDAQSYNVSLDGGTTWTNDLNNSMTLDQLETGTTYSIIVCAVGDETTTANSAWSDPLSVTTLGTPAVALFHENFSKIQRGWTASYSYLANDEGLFSCDEQDWMGYKVSRRPSCVQIGLTTSHGYAQTRTIALTNNLCSGEVTVSFYALSLEGSTTGLRAMLINEITGETNHVFSAEESSIGSLDLPKRSSDDVTDITTEAPRFSAVLSNIPELFALRFEPRDGNKRIAIDAITVKQHADTSLDPLATPVVTNDTVVSQTSLSFGWPVVTGAAGYAVEVRDKDGVRLSLDTTVHGTLYTLNDLPDDTTYSVRVRALAPDGSTTLMNSLWSEAAEATTLTAAAHPSFVVSTNGVPIVEEVPSFSVMAMSNLSFSVTAKVQNVPIALDFLLDPAEPSVAPTYNTATGAFSWTPADADAGTYAVSFVSGIYTQKVAIAVTARPELVNKAPVFSDVDWNTFTATWDTTQPRDSHVYALRVWYGSCNMGSESTDQETFTALPTHPSQWAFSGSFGTYNDNLCKLQLKSADSSVTTKLYPGVLSSIKFHTKCTSGTKNSVLTVYGSEGGTEESDWVSITNITTSGSTHAHDIDLSDASYRRIKWKLTTWGGNVGLGNIIAAYPGAGTKWVIGSLEEPATVTAAEVPYVVSSLRPDKEYFVQVMFKEDGGEYLSDTAWYYRVVTPEAPKVTLIRIL